MRVGKSDDDLENYVVKQQDGRKRNDDANYKRNRASIGWGIGLKYLSKQYSCFENT